MNQSLEERRRYPRFEKKVPLSLTIVNKYKQRDISGQIPVHTKNISQGGMLLEFPMGWICADCIQCRAWSYNQNCKLKNNNGLNNLEELTRCIPPKTILKIAVEPPAFLTSQQVMAQVVWVKPPDDLERLSYHMGVRFLKEEIK